MQKTLTLTTLMLLLAATPAAAADRRGRPNDDQARDAARQVMTMYAGALDGRMFIGPSKVVGDHSRVLWLRIRGPVPQLWRVAVTSRVHTFAIRIRPLPL